MNDSILTSIKKLLGMTEEFTAYDEQVIMHINSVFSVLTQLGVGPTAGFSIDDSSTVWGDFVDDTKLEMVKSYMGAKVRLLFDLPQSAAHIEALNNQVKEFEWRLNIAVDPSDTFEE